MILYECMLGVIGGWNYDVNIENKDELVMVVRVVVALIVVSCCSEVVNNYFFSKK